MQFPLKIGWNLICLLSLEIVSAANGLDTWAGTTSSMNTAANWTVGSANRPPINGDSLLFPSAVSSFSVNNDIPAGLSVVGMTLNSTSPYTLSGNPFTFSNGNTLAFQDASGGHTISANIGLTSGNLIITNAAPSNTIAGSLNLGGGTLTYTGSSPTSALVLTGANSYSGTTTVSAGTLRAGSSNVFSANSQMILSSGTTLDLNNFSQSVKSIFGSGNVSLGSGTLSLISQATTYSGVISGTGGVNLSTNLDLTSSQAYTGPTVVNNPAKLGLSASGSISSSSSVTINGSLLTAFLSATTTLQNISGTNSVAFIQINTTTNPTSLTLTGSQNTTFNGHIETFSTMLDAGVIKQGIGTLTLTNDQSSYQGGTYFDAGIIKITVPDAGVKGPLGNPNVGMFVFNGGTLETDVDYITSKPVLLTGAGTIQVDATRTSTFNSLFTGAGSFTKSGNGTLILSASNSYTGNTSITAGALRSTGNNSFNDSALVTLSAGALWDMGNTTQKIQALSGDGSVTIGAGELSVNTGSFSGTITGTGTFETIGTGTFTLTNTGSINLTGGSSLIDLREGITIIDGDIAAHSVTVTGGTLKGTGNVTSTLPIPIDTGAILAPGDSPGVIHIMGDVTFDSLSILDIELNPMVASELIATGTVDVTQAILSINPDPGTYTNGTLYTIVSASSVLSPFDAVVVNAQAATRNFNVIYSPDLIQLEVSTVPFSTILGNSCTSSPAITAAAYETSNPENGDVQFITNFLNQANSSQLFCDFDQMNNALFNAVAIVQETVTTAMRSFFTDRLQEIHGPVCSGIEAKRKGIWVAPFGNFESQKSRLRSDECDPTRLGFHSSSYGAILAADQQVSSTVVDQVYLGGSLSYAHTDLDWRHAQATSHAHTGLATLYATLFKRHFYLNAIFMGGLAYFDAKRHIFLQNIMESLTRSAKHHNFAGDFDGHIEMGFSWSPRHMQIRPYAMLDYIYLRESGYREKGAQSLDLVVQARTSKLLREELGLSLTLCQQARSSTFSEEFRFAYVHEERFRGKETKARFVDSEDDFKVEGFTPNRNLFAPTFTFNACWSPIFSLSATYAGEFGEKWSNQTANLKWLWKF